MSYHVTLHPVVVDSQRRPDGTYNVKIRLTFKRVPRIIATNITAYPDDVTQKKPRKLKANSNAMQRAQELCIQMYRALDDLNYTTLQLSSADFLVGYIERKLFAGKDFRLDFFEYGYSYAKTKHPDKRTGLLYETSLNAFARYLGRKNIDISEINKPMLVDFFDYLKNDKISYKGGRTAQCEKKTTAPYVYMAKLKTIYNAAKAQYNDEDEGVINIPRNPFANIDLSFRPPLKRTAKTVKEMQAIISDSSVTSKVQRRALDIYILSFALWGLNLIDFYYAAAPVDDILEINRTKVKDKVPDAAYARIKIDPRLKPFIDRVRSSDPRFFLELKRPDDMNGQKLRYLSIGATGGINEALQRYATKRGLETFTYYSARHSFATIARSSACGIDKATVDEMLLHAGDMRMADRYIEKDWKIYWEANKKLLDLFEWPEQ